ncbi:hypothetical protein [Aquimarina litoralis]|uniref:hypothetical protein n=1 Tax=Aquimarina litoralis TaxID=584605 RepID=UPI001C598A32|nr:hypothetical protein [Aquimarina litoralis]MBW1298440.1 hypothetical protein [Aquimarina litoralis]
MKKSLLSLGKVLTKSEQKNVVGGATITHYDPYCDLYEGQIRPGCPCVQGSACMTVDYERMVPVPGTCQGSVCVA